MICCQRCGEWEEDEYVATATYNSKSFRKEVKLCSRCANRLYHWFKMECHRYGCDEQ